MYSSIQILHFGTSEGREQYHIQKVSVPKKGNLFNNVKSNNNVMISNEGIKQTVKLKQINEM